jgi:hypothetical protein
MGTAAAAGVLGTDVTLLSRLVSDPECQLKATMEEASSSALHRNGAFWEPLAAALLRASSPAKANLVSPSLIVPILSVNALFNLAVFAFRSIGRRKWKFPSP